MPYKDPAKRREAIRKSQLKHSEKWNEYRKRYAQEHPELYRDASRRWRERNREKSRAGVKAYWDSLPDDVRKQKQRAANLGRYGVTPEWYDAKFAEQHGVCALCKRPSRRRLCVDHDHNKNKKNARGLLCGGCNVLLHSGIAPEWYEEAAAYLKRYKGESNL